MRRFLYLFSILFVIKMAHSTVLQYLELEDIALRSEAIIRGVVKEVSSRYNEERTKIFTYSVIEIRETFKGKTPPVVTVRTYGGRVGDISMKVPGMPEFKKNEEVFLFLKKNDEYWHVTGMIQGKFSILKDEKNEEYMVNEFKDITFKKINENNKLEDLNTANIPSKIHYVDFVKKLKVIIENQKGQNK